MTDEKNPPQRVVYHESLRWEVRHDQDGLVTLTIYKGLLPSVVEMTADDALYMAYTLLSDVGDDFDLAAATRRLSALALARQIEPYRHDDLRTGELAIGHDDIDDAGGLILDGVGEGG